MVGHHRNKKNVWLGMVCMSVIPAL
jgi:hypothetical protein